MSDESLICPECGGIIGAKTTTEQGAPCKCGKAAGADDSAVMAATNSAAKVCCKCGKDLSHEKRLRDSDGYWCVACHKEDQRLKSAKGVACADCGRIVPEAALMRYEGLLICSKCRFDRSEAAKHKKKFSGKLDDKHFQEANKKGMLLLLGILGALILVIILSKLHVF